MKRFMLGVICGLLIGGGGYALTQADEGWDIMQDTMRGKRHYPSEHTAPPLNGPQNYLDTQTGKMHQFQQLGPRNPC